MDLNQIEKSRWVEGEREEERRVKQLSESKVHGPFTSAKGAARSSWLSTFRDKKALSQESPLSALLLLGTDGPEERTVAGCDFCSSGKLALRR